MINNRDDEQIKKLLKRWTNVDKSIQKQTWEQIEGQLFPKRPAKYIWVAALTTVVVLMFVTFGLITQTGQAVVQEIKDIFVPEKQQDVVIEGNKETTDVKLNMNESLDFIIYVDEDGYKMEQTEDVARIVTKEPLGDIYPDVYMEISQMNGEPKEKIIESIKDDLQKEQMLIFREEEVTEPIEATMILGFERDDVTDDIRHGWDTVVLKYYLYEVSDEQFFMIKQVYFQEAMEGHGVRFDYMLESFEVIH